MLRLTACQGKENTINMTRYIAAVVYIVLALVAHLVRPCPVGCNCFLNVVDCSNRELTSLIDGIPAETEELFLQGNSLKELTANQFANFTNLEYLYLHENQISNISSSAFVKVAPKLKLLTLHDNKIASLQTGVFANMTSLMVLNLDENLLESLPVGLLSDCVSMIQISIQRNKLGNVDGAMFLGLSRLKYIGLAYNKLTRLPTLAGEDFPDLYLLDVENNLIEILSSIPSSLQQLYANTNSIKTLPVSTFSSAASLYQLFLKFNQISQVDNNAFVGATSLGWIDLTGNKISSVSDNTFDNLPRMKGLYLASNKGLTSFSDRAFASSQTTLSRLSLNNCSFTHLNREKLDYLTNDDLYVWLADNPWDCDCGLQGLSAYATQKGKYINDIDSALCQTPPQLEGMRIDEVSYSGRCQQNLALIIALPIVCGMILVLGLAALLYKTRYNSSKRRTMEVKGSGSVSEEISSIRT